MNEYEEKLHSFRKEKRKEQILNQCKAYLWHLPISSLSSLIPSRSPADTNLAAIATDPSVPLITDDNPSSHSDKHIYDDDTGTESDHTVETAVTEDVTDDLQLSVNWVKLASSVLLWICLFSYSIYIEFGAIFFIFSCFYVIWTNTRTGPRKRNEISAYSVFNPNCERIDGTFDAKQLESEMLYGGMF